MNTILLVIAVIILLILAWMIYRVKKVRRQREQLTQERFKRIQPLFEKVESGQAITKEDVAHFAEDRMTREMTYQLLSEAGKTDLFPADLYTIEKGAESNLANWLEFPTELDGCPDEMELVKKVVFNLDNREVEYYVFKFRINEPHWAAKDGWMLGVAGPYFDDSKPYDFPAATFSRLSSKYDTTSPDEEAKWVHDNIASRVS